MPQAYKVLKTRILGGVVYAKEGETVYQCALHDYGKVAQESNLMGVPHTYVTTRANGDYPAFTIPSGDLLPVAIFNVAEATLPNRRRR